LLFFLISSVQILILFASPIFLLWSSDLVLGADFLILALVLSVCFFPLNRVLPCRLMLILILVSTVALDPILEPEKHFLLQNLLGSDGTLTKNILLQ